MADGKFTSGSQKFALRVMRFRAEMFRLFAAVDRPGVLISVLNDENGSQNAVADRHRGDGPVVDDRVAASAGAVVALCVRAV